MSKYKGCKLGCACINPFHLIFKPGSFVRPAEKLACQSFSINGNWRYKALDSMFETGIQTNPDFEFCACLTLDVTLGLTILFIHFWLKFFEGSSAFCIDNRDLKVANFGHAQMHRT